MSPNTVKDVLLIQNIDNVRDDGKDTVNVSFRVSSINISIPLQREVMLIMQVLNSGYADYIRPPIDCYKTLQFGSFDEISDVGYSHARELFSEWARSGRIQELFMELGEKSKATAAAVTAVDPKFTDLAELVSRIDWSPASAAASAHVSDDDMSVTSEPAIVTLHTSPRRRKAGSEGTSPGSVTASSDNEDDVDARMRDFDDDEVIAMSSLTDIPQIVQDGCSASSDAVDKI